MGDRSLHCGYRHFGRFRLLWPWLWLDDLINCKNLTRIAWRYTLLQPQQYRCQSNGQTTQNNTEKGIFIETAGENIWTDGRVIVVDRLQWSKQRQQLSGHRRSSSSSVSSCGRSLAASRQLCSALWWTSRDAK